MNGPALIDPAAVFEGTVLIAAPHMDDEVLGCGGTVARLPEKRRIHVVFATDGARSPAPSFPWLGRTASNLPAIRRAEADAALTCLEVPAANRHYLHFPDGNLRAHIVDAREALLRLFTRLRPSYVFVPFRYDRHPDHLALHAAALDAHSGAGGSSRIVEYFVYYRWRLIPGGDLRALIAPEHLLAVSIESRSRQKQRALQCYLSQTTRIFDWQDRPILPAERVAEVSTTPELFLLRNPALSGTAVFRRLRRWIPIAHRAEPALKVAKDRLQTWLWHRFGRYIPQALP